MIVCAGSIEQFDFATPIGVGLIESAINLTELVIKRQPKKIIFVGTAGSYGKREILELLSSNSATNIELSALQNQSYTPIVSSIRSSYLLPLESVTVNCSNYITTDNDLAKRFLDQQIDIENMEFFSVLAVANRFNIPAGGIFCVTNYCNANAHNDFKANHQEAMRKIAAFIKANNLE